MKDKIFPKSSKKTLVEKVLEITRISRVDLSQYYIEVFAVCRLSIMILVQKI